jgi:hypothetical protein
VSPETFWSENSAGGWSPMLSVIGRLQIDGWDVPAVVVEAEGAMTDLTGW